MKGAALTPTLSGTDRNMHVFASNTSWPNWLAAQPRFEADRRFGRRRGSRCLGIHGRAGQRNAPTVLDALYNKTHFWDGRAKTLEEQAALPITRRKRSQATASGGRTFFIPICGTNKYFAELFATAAPYALAPSLGLRTIAGFAIAAAVTTAAIVPQDFEAKIPRCH